MKNTCRRLDEAIFFLNKMKENKNVTPDFDYYLNAFFDSARSVLWIMRAEYCKVDGWEKWFEEKDTTEKIKRLISNITEARNRSTKKEALKVNTYMTVGSENKFIDLAEYLKLFAGKEITLEVKTISPDDVMNDVDVTQKEGKISIRGMLEICDSINEFKRQDICEVCQEYIEWLQEVVIECQERFG